MKNHLVLSNGGNTLAQVTAAASAQQFMPTLRDGVTIPQLIFVSVERGKEAFFKQFVDFFAPPADAALMLITDKAPQLLENGRMSLFRHKEKTAGATLYVTPQANQG